MKFDSQLLPVRKSSSTLILSKPDIWDRSSSHAGHPLARMPSGNEHEVCFANAKLDALVLELSDSVLPPPVRILQAADLRFVGLIPLTIA
jgi:hypothetical protein